MWMRRTAVAGLLLLTTACVTEAPQLVRDGGDLMEADTEASTEARLQELARDTGVWVFVLTAATPDPPRMLDEPMALADARGVRALALIIGPNGLVSYGASRASTANGDYDNLAGLDFAVGSLDELLTDIEAWVRDGRTPPPVPAVPGGPVGPSGPP